MELKNKSEEIEHEMPKKSTGTVSTNRMIDVYSLGIAGDDDLSDTAIVYGLCSSCYNLRQCVWEEKNKIYCEHYQ